MRRGPAIAAAYGIATLTLVAMLVWCGLDTSDPIALREPARPGCDDGSRGPRHPTLRVGAGAVRAAADAHFVVAARCADDASRDPLDALVATRVSGRVVDGHGLVEDDDRIVVHARSVFGDHELEASPAADGSFALELRDRGAFVVAARAESAMSDSIVVDGARGIVIDVGTLELVARGADADAKESDESAAPLVGHVVDATGNPVANCAVRANGREARTDARGNFEIPRTVDGEVDVVARHPRSGSGRASALRAEPVRITLRPVAGLLATLDEPATFGAEPTVAVDLLRTGASGACAERATFGVETRWLERGVVRVDGLELGARYRVRVHGSRGVCATCEIDVPSEPPPHALVERFVVRGGTSVVVTVVDARGAAMSHATVVVAAQDEPLDPPTHAVARSTDETGIATFADRPALAHVVRCSRRGYATALARVDAVAAGGARHVSITLDECARIEGHCPAPLAAAPAPWLRITQPSASRWTRIRGDGSFAVDDLAPGYAAITLWPAPLARVPEGDASPELPTRVVDLAPAAMHRVEFVEDVSRAIGVDVDVVDRDGRPVAASRTRALLDARVVAEARTDAAGRARLVLPWAGTFTLVVDGDRESDPRARVEAVAFDSDGATVRIAVEAP